MGEALALLAGGDPELFRIIGRTLAISGAATVLAMLAGVPLGYALARGRFPGRTVLLGAVNTGMGMPPVVVGSIRASTSRGRSSCCSPRWARP
jgi:tungstate transport system permease protein